MKKNLGCVLTSGLAVLTVVCHSAPSRAADYRGVVGVDYSQDAGNSYVCATTAAVTTQAGVSLSSPTLSLYNPIGSGKNLSLLEVSLTQTNLPAAAVTAFLAFNVTPSSGTNVSTNAVTAAVVTGMAVGKSTGTFVNAIAKCNTQGFLPTTPVAFRYETTFSTPTTFTDPVQGKVVVPPGGLVSVQTSAAGSLQAGMLWREDPL